MIFFFKKMCILLTDLVLFFLKLLYLTLNLHVYVILLKHLVIFQFAVAFNYNKGMLKLLL